MPHLLVFNRSYYPDLGATGQLLTELCEDLVAHYGWQVTVVASLPTVTVNGTNGSDNSTGGSAGWGLVRRETVRGVVVLRAVGTRLAKARFVGRAANYVSYFASAVLAGGWARRPDVVMSLTDPPILGLAALAWARRWRVPFVFLCQDIFPEVAVLLEDFQSPMVNRLLERINRLLIRNANRVVVLGETMGKRLITEKGVDPGRLRVIHNWADCSAIMPGEKRNPWSVATRLADRFVVMHSGNIGLSQNLDILLEAADRLRSYTDVVMAMVGDGAKREALEARARSQGLANVRFLPYQPKERVTESFAAADVFIISLKEGLAGYIVPSKLYGILAAGRPYVAAVEEACEVAAITRKYECGLLAKPGDPDDLADKILTLYHDRELVSRLGANARRAALEFDRPLQVRAYYDLFRELQV
ncbi:MAG: glycosyltransferase family 4 protein [candidate division NC10 bacterium]|nr:glycosyltransferase family 4 protein [candidate division NC10 bacterium]